MDTIAIIGATGSLGGEILRRALRTHQVTAVVRSPGKLMPHDTGLKIRQVDLATASVGAIAGVLAGHDAVVNAAGHVSDGQTFVDLVDKLIRALESIAPSERPVCWFLAGAAVLDIGNSDKRGVDLPVVKARYWAHGSNYARLSRSQLDWRLLCPGPLTGPELDAGTLRVSVDRLPVEVPQWFPRLPGPLLTLAFARLVPQLTIPAGNAAEYILDHLSVHDPVSRHRVGLALPSGNHLVKSIRRGSQDDSPIAS